MGTESYFEKIGICIRLIKWFESGRDRTTPVEPRTQNFILNL